MDTSTGDSGGASSGGGADTGGLATGGVIGAAAGFFGGGGGGPAGLRGAGLRGILQTQQLLLSRLLRASAVQANFDAATRAASGKFVASEHPFLKEIPAVTPQTKALGDQLIKAKTIFANAVGARRQKNAAQRVALVERRQAKLAAQLQPQATEVYVAEYGIASGQPVRGSRDDPNGIRYPNLRTSLLEGV